MISEKVLQALREYGFVYTAAYIEKFGEENLLANSSFGNPEEVYKKALEKGEPVEASIKNFLKENAEYEARTGKPREVVL